MVAFWLHTERIIYFHTPLLPNASFHIYRWCTNIYYLCSAFSTSTAPRCNITGGLLLIYLANLSAYPFVCHTICTLIITDCITMDRQFITSSFDIHLFAMHICYLTNYIKMTNFSSYQLTTNFVCHTLNSTDLH